MAAVARPPPRNLPARQPGLDDFLKRRIPGSVADRIVTAVRHRVVLSRSTCLRTPRDQTGVMAVRQRRHIPATSLITRPFVAASWATGAPSTSAAASHSTSTTRPCQRPRPRTPPTGAAPARGPQALEATGPPRSFQRRRSVLTIRSRDPRGRQPPVTHGHEEGVSARSTPGNDRIGGRADGDVP